MLRPIATNVAAAAIMLAATHSSFAAEPLCGDVNQSDSVTSSDALLVLKDAVGQSVTLYCPDYAIPATCGNELAESEEPCDGPDLHGKTCATEAPETPYGTLACSAGCDGFDTTDCVARFDTSGATILDYATGLEWEKKENANNTVSTCPGGDTCANPHDADNWYSWCTGTGSVCTNSASPFDGSAATDFLAKLNGAGGPGTCYAGHCDWRLPTAAELLGVPWSANPDLGPGSAGKAADKWSATSADYALPGFAIYVNVSIGGSGATDKPSSLSVRAVRNAS